MPESAASAMLSERVWYASAAATKKIEPMHQSESVASVSEISCASSVGFV